MPLGVEQGVQNLPLETGILANFPLLGIGLCAQEAGVEHHLVYECMGIDRKRVVPGRAGQPRMHDVSIGSIRSGTALTVEDVLLGRWLGET